MESPLLPKLLILCCLTGAFCIGQTSFAQSITNTAPLDDNMFPLIPTEGFRKNAAELRRQANVDFQAGRNKEAASKFKEGPSIDPDFVVSRRERMQVKINAVLDPKFPITKTRDGTLQFVAPVNVHKRSLRETPDDLNR